MRQGARRPPRAAAARLAGALRLVALAVAAPPPAAAATDPAAAAAREAAMFGEAPAAPAPAGGAGPPPTSIFGGPADTGLAEDAVRERGAAPPAGPGGGAGDTLAIGGFYFLRGEYDVLDGGSPSSWPLTSPNLLDLYFDARPSARLRGYFRGRATYNPTLQAGYVSPLTLTRPPQALLLLDQLWLKFDVARRLFVTVGRQPLRWGAGRFWNPTDFINNSHRDPLAVFDERIGVALIRLNLPLEALGWNLVALVNITNYDASSFLGQLTADALGGALRAEVLLGASELTLTANGRQGGPLQLGADLSAGLGPLDVRAEVAVQHGVQQQFFAGSPDGRAGPWRQTTRPDTWFVQAVAGAEVALRYSDTDSVIVGAEGFYNQLGYGRVDDYLPAIADFQGRGLSPPFLYLGRAYGAAFVNLTHPGSLDNTVLTASAVVNLSDRTVLSRLDWQVRALTHLDVNAYAAVHAGGQGELHFAVDIPAGLTQALPHGYSRPAPRLEAGLGLRLYF